MTPRGDLARRIHVLIVEDNARDAELLEYELRRGGFDPVCRRVDTEADYREGLRWDVDLVLADYSLPSFSAPRALDVLLASGRDVPLLSSPGRSERSRRSSACGRGRPTTC